MEPDAVEIRVVACLVEKQRATPDHYPLSLNALRLACNQSTNRDPVVDYDEATVSDAPAADGAARAGRGWRAGPAAGPASTATCSARHSRRGAGELAVLAVLMLRGAQTPGELKGRTERLHPFDDLAAVQATLERLGERGYAARLGRRPGQREDRYEHLLGGEEDRESTASAVPGEAAVPSDADAPGQAAVPDDADLIDTGRSAAAEDDRLARLEAELLDLRGEFAKLREQLGG